MPRSRAGKRAMAIGLGLTAVLALTVGLVAESALSYTVSAMGALGAAAVKRAEMWEAAEEQERRANRRPPAEPRPAAPPKPPLEPEAEGGRSAPPRDGQVRCTQTGKIATECGCASRHVATAEGAATYGRNIGDPIGRRTRARKPATTKTGGPT